MLVGSRGRLRHLSPFVHASTLPCDHKLKLELKLIISLSSSFSLWLHPAVRSPLACPAESTELLLSESLLSASLMPACRAPPVRGQD